MKKTVLPLLLVFIVCNSFSQQLVRLHPLVGDTISQAEKKQYRIFPFIDAQIFNHAYFLGPVADNYSTIISKTNGTTDTIRYTIGQFKELQQYLDHYSEKKTAQKSRRFINPKIFIGFNFSGCNAFSKAHVARDLSDAGYGQVSYSGSWFSFERFINGEPTERKRSFNLFSAVRLDSTSTIKLLYNRSSYTLEAAWGDARENYNWYDYVNSYTWLVSYKRYLMTNGGYGWIKISADAGVGPMITQTKRSGYAEISTHSTFVNTIFNYKERSVLPVLSIGIETSVFLGRHFSVFLRPGAIFSLPFKKDPNTFELQRSWEVPGYKITMSRFSINWGVAFSI